MKVKTYAINGLSEWHGDVKAGSISVRVSFTGGTVSPSGALPAYMVSKDPVTQFVIENSKEFKSGFIRLEMVQEVPGKHHRQAEPRETKGLPLSPSQGNTHPLPLPEGGASECQGTGDDTHPLPLPEGGASEGQGTGESSSKEEDENVGRIEVPDKYEAIEWLKEHFPDKKYTATSLRTKTAFEAACKECGVEFVFTA